MLQVGWKLEQEQRRSSSCCCCCCFCGGGGVGCFVPLEPASSTNCKSKCQTSTYNFSLLLLLLLLLFVCVCVLGSCFWELINEVSRGGWKNDGSLVWINFIIAKLMVIWVFQPSTLINFILCCCVSSLVFCLPELISYWNEFTFKSVVVKCAKNGSCYWLNNLSSFWKDPMAIYAF